MRIITVLIVLLLFVHRGNSVAATDAPFGDLSMTPFVGNYSFAQDQGLKSGVIAGGRFGLSLNSQWGIEGSVGALSTKQESDGQQIHVSLWDLSAVYHFKPIKRWDPFIKAGAGGINVGPRGANAKINYGAGVHYLLVPKRVALRAEAQQIHDFDNPNAVNNMEYSIGVTFLAPKPVPPAPVQAPKSLLDSDHDNVLDVKDVCPNTRTGEPVDETGCPIDQDKDRISDLLDLCPMTPAGIAVDKNGCPLDNDSDRVPDTLDKCQGTLPGIIVDKNGCPLDSDADRIPDTVDKCPNTILGIAVDETGCPLDADGDKVPDTIDKCAGTLPGVGVDETGCPLDSDADGVLDTLDQCSGTLPKVAVDGNGCSLDADSDGVPDTLDQCPNVFGTDDSGCPLDSDFDSVPDVFDLCPGTPKGRKVNPFGCPRLDNGEEGKDDSRMDQGIVANPIERFKTRGE